VCHLLLHQCLEPQLIEPGRAARNELRCQRREAAVAVVVSGGLRPCVYCCQIGVVASQLLVAVVVAASFHFCDSGRLRCSTATPPLPCRSKCRRGQRARYSGAACHLAVPTGLPLLLLLRLPRDDAVRCARGRLHHSSWTLESVRAAWWRQRRWSSGGSGSGAESHHPRPFRDHRSATT